MEPSIETTPKSGTRQKPYKLPGFGGVFARVKTATFEKVTTATLELGDRYVQDEWRRRFGNRSTIIPADENKPYLDVLRETGVDVEDIPAFIAPYPSSNRWERLVKRVQAFCNDAENILDNRNPSHPSDNRAAGDAQMPKAWVSDVNSIPQADPSNRRIYNRVLKNQDLYEVLKRKRFSEETPGKIPGNSRRIYIRNADGLSVLSLLRTAPASQVDGFRKLFACYLNPSPVPKLVLSDSDWWGGASFVIAFNLPFFAIDTQNRHDNRTFSGGKQKLRASYDLDFLYFADRTLADLQENSTPEQHPILHEAVYSFILTGCSENYWTAVCLDDDYFDEESRLADEEEIEHVEDCQGDPIIFQAELKTTRVPRSYALTALAKELEKIVEYHGDIQECLKASIDHYFTIAGNGLNPDRALRQRLREWRKHFPEILSKVICHNSSLTTKVNEFLADNGIVGPKEALQGPLWQGLQGDVGALRSLRAIKSLCAELRDINVHLEQLKESYDEVRRERKDYDADKQKSRDRTTQHITVAAFVLGILNLIAQVYAGKPGTDDPASRPGYIALVSIFIAICVPGTAVFLWLYETQNGRDPWLRLLKTLKKTEEHLCERLTSFNFGVIWAWIHLAFAAFVRFATNLSERRRQILPT